jgi:DNA-binding NtrC family response regulator
MQPKLLRLLETKRIRPLGDKEERAVNVRFVAATNRDLSREVREGRFREDLYYRLNVVEIRLPPLRERIGDLPDLVKHLFAQHGLQDPVIHPQAMKLLAAHPWPGNVRELDNELARAAVLAGTGPIREQHLSPHIRGKKSASRGPMIEEATDVIARGAGSLSERLVALERKIIREALRASGGNRTAAAKALGMSRQGLVRRLQTLRLKVPRSG